jgi:hypothetical protein
MRFPHLIVAISLPPANPCGCIDFTLPSSGHVGLLLVGAGRNLLGAAIKIGTERWHVVSRLAQREFVRPMLNYLVDVAIDGNLTSRLDGDV